MPLLKSSMSWHHNVRAEAHETQDDGPTADRVPLNIPRPRSTDGSRTFEMQTEQI